MPAAVRLARWAGDRTVADRLVLILAHRLRLRADWFFHGWLGDFHRGSTGDGGHSCLDRRRLGLMTVAVMTGDLGTLVSLCRRTRHAGDLRLLLAGVLVRIVAAFMGSVDLLEFAGLCWTAAFILFVLLYGPLLAMRSPGWSETRR
jgi:uncharacterized protein involved in response to NO